MTKIWTVVALTLLAVLLGACADNEVTETPQETLTTQATWPTVQQGAEGQTVKTIQYLLRYRGQSLSVDGIFGAGTAQAVRNIQSANSLAVDGVVGTNTWGALTETVRQGDDGDAVRAVQSELGITVDGDFGPATNNAVRNFQGANNLTVDGVVGPNTWATLVGGSGSGGSNPGEVCYPSGLCLSVTTSQPTGPNQTYWDPNNSGNPLLAISDALGEQISANFTVQEFVSSGSTTFPYARIDPELIKLVQGLRTAFGQPLIINSGYRSHAYNEMLEDAAPYSQHQSGRAVDIRGSGLSGLDIAKKAIDTYGCNIGVGVGTGYAHIDVRGTYASWEYNSGLEAQIDSYRSAVCG